jgi:hypothetical protein
MNSGRDASVRIEPTPRRHVRMGKAVPSGTPDNPDGAAVDSLARLPEFVRVEGGEYRPEHFVQQLEPGTVYLDVGCWGGGPPAPVERGYSPAAAVIERPSFDPPLGETPAWQSEKGVVFESWFQAWGQSWTVLVVAQQPFPAESLQAAFDAVASLYFPPTPVTTQNQAVERALTAIPPSMIPPPGKGGPDCFAPYRLAVSGRQAPFRIHFRHYAAGTESLPASEVTVLVHRNGEIIPDD